MASSKGCTITLAFGDEIVMVYVVILVQHLRTGYEPTPGVALVEVDAGARSGSAADGVTAAHSEDARNARASSRVHVARDTERRHASCSTNNTAPIPSAGVRLRAARGSCSEQGPRPRGSGM